MKILCRLLYFLALTVVADSLRPGWDEQGEPLESGADHKLMHKKRDHSDQLQSLQVLTSAHVSRGRRHIISEEQIAASIGIHAKKFGTLHESEDRPVVTPLVDAAMVNIPVIQGLAFIQEESSKASPHHAAHHSQSRADHTTSNASQSQKQDGQGAQNDPDDDDEDGGQVVQNITAAEMLAGTPAPLLQALLGASVRRSFSIPMWLFAMLSIAGGFAFSWRLYSIWNRGRLNLAGDWKSGTAFSPGDFPRHASGFSNSRGIVSPLMGSGGKGWCSLDELMDLTSSHVFEHVSIERSSVSDQVFKAQEAHPELLSHISAVMDNTPSPKVRNWAAKNLADIFLILGLKADALKTGLAQDEASKRLSTHGRNELEAKGLGTFLHIFSSAVLSKTGVLVALASTLAVLLFDFLDAAALIGGIASAGVIAAFSGCRLHRTSQSVTSSKALCLQSRCLRDGAWSRLPADELVPGDVVRIVAGDRVAADLRVVAADGLWVDESLLCGPAGYNVEKRGMVEPLDQMCGLPENILYAHTNAIKGSGIAIVVETGVNTRIGRLYKILSQAGGVAKIAAWMSCSPTWRLAKSWGGPIIVVCLAFNVVTFLLSGLSHFEDPDAPSAAGKGWRYSVWLRASQVALLLAVKVVPQMLAPWCTTCLIVGNERALQKGALVRKPSAMQTLNACTTVCSDMSGIFTDGCLTAVNLFGSLPEPHTFEFDEGSCTDGGSGSVFLLDRSSRPKRIDKDLSKSDSQEHAFVTSALTLACMNCHGTLSSDQVDYDPLGPQATYEAPVIALAHQCGVETSNLSADFPVVMHLPFNSSSKLQITVHALPQESQEFLSLHLPAKTSHVAVIKGAPEKLITRLTCSLSAKEGRSGWEVCGRDADLLQGVVESQNARFAAAALRVLLCAVLPLTQKEFSTLQEMTDVDALIEAMLHDLVFVSLLSFRDPVREQVRPAVDRCLLTGIRVVMVTGDQVDTAQAVARSIGVPGKAHLAATLRLSCGAYRHTAEIMDLCGQVNIWARVEPEDKVVITKALQELAQVCVVTGGSVDDLPVLYQADVGMALGSGQAVAKHIADVVLTESSFVGVVNAIEEARRTSGNFKKAVMYLLGINVGEFIGHAVALVAHLPKSFGSIGLLLSLVTSTIGMLPLCWEPADSRAMTTALAPPARRHLMMLPMWLGLPMTMIATMYLGLVLHVGAVHSHQITNLCEYAWHPEDIGSDGMGGNLVRWRRDEAPYHCHCPALEGDQWGRHQSRQNNINTAFSRSSGSSGLAYAKNEGPFKAGVGSALEPCNGRTGTPAEGALCWKARFLVPARPIHHSGVESKSDEMPWFRNIVLHPEWNCARYGTRLAKSMAWFATILTQALFFQSVRSSQPLMIVYWRNTRAVASFFATISLALLAMYVPRVNEMLHLAPLPLTSLILACMGPVAALTVAEASKMALQAPRPSELGRIDC